MAIVQRSATPPRISEVADAVGLDLSTTSRHCATLGRDGLMERIEDETDRRAFRLRLTPAGKKFTQAAATQFSKAEHLIFACGRYEGIDSRVTTFYQNQKNLRVHEVSIGDYVLNGGEVAALAITEAVVRLIPGVLGNPDSLVEESHNQAGVVEYPTFTKPPEWRGLKVPEILTSGNHGAIANWRAEQAEIRSQNANRELE
jgi:tRNA (guanine37-N1)-methyltransferase